MNEARLKIGRIKNKIGADELYKYILNLKGLPRKVRQVLDQSDNILEIAKKIRNAKRT